MWFLFAYIFILCLSIMILHNYLKIELLCTVKRYCFHFDISLRDPMFLCYNIKTASNVRSNTG